MHDEESEDRGATSKDGVACEESGKDYNSNSCYNNDATDTDIHMNERGRDKVEDNMVDETVEKCQPKRGIVSR